MVEPVDATLPTPGLIETQAQKEEMNLSSDYQNRYLQELPLGRVGQPSDIAKMVLFLASPDADWISGQLHVVDGGLMAGHLSFQGVHDFAMLYGTGVGAPQGSRCARPASPALPLPRARFAAAGRGWSR